VIPPQLQQRIPEPLRAGLVLTPVTAEEVRARSHGLVTRPIWAASDPELRAAGLFDATIFGPGWDDPTPGVDRERVEGTVDTFISEPGKQFGHIELAIPVAHPMTGETLEAIPVLPPSLRPLVYLHGARYSASNLNDLYQRVIEVSARLRRLLTMDPDHAARHAVELARAVEQLFSNGTTQPARTPTGRPISSIADHLRAAGREGVKTLLFALCFRATWT
jgi:DNA-directed RNA polymerase beta' subunit